MHNEHPLLRRTVGAASVANCWLKTIPRLVEYILAAELWWEFWRALDTVGHAQSHRRATRLLKPKYVEAASRNVEMNYRISDQATMSAPMVTPTTETPPELALRLGPSRLRSDRNWTLSPVRL